MNSNAESFNCLKLCDYEILAENIDGTRWNELDNVWLKFRCPQKTRISRLQCICEINPCLVFNGPEGSGNSFCKINSESTKALEDSLYRLLTNLLLTKSVLHLHSSFVLYKGRALVFTGPSGIGKTTQAELWRDFQGAEIINGDACLLRELEDGWHAFGTPVHGSSPYCENKDAPLAALVALEQGPENRLVRLDSFAALTTCLPEFYRPQMDPATQDIFWGAVDSLFRKTPVYRLVCRPDRDATELVKRTVFPAG